MAFFAFFGLWETTLVAAIGGASIPIIIHLLNRRRFRVVTWAAMKFLLAAQKQNTRKMRLEQLILLAVRVLLILVIILAMASVMPWAERVWAHFWPDGAGFVQAPAGRTYRIIVLDGSLSMNLSEGGKTGFERARQMAVNLVQSAPAGDGFSVCLMKDSPTWIVPEPSQDARKVARELEVIRPAHGNAAAAATLNKVAEKLTEAAGRFPTREVYFFTDMQRATWAAGAPKETQGEGQPAKEKTPLHKIQTQARTIFVDVGRADAPNLAVTDLRLSEAFVTTGALTAVTATVQNFGTKTRRNVRVELLTGRAREAGNDQPFAPRVVGQELIDLKAGERTTVNFVHKFSAAGNHALQVKLEADDLELDDVRTVIVTVKDTIPLLLVNGKPAADRYEQATEYLRLALNPFPANASPKWAPLRPRVVSVAQFADKSEAELAEFDCIFLCDVPQLGAPELRRLETHLRRGGGLGVALGERAADHLDVYNRLLFKGGQGLLPAELVKKIHAPAEHSFTLSAQDDAYLEPPLKAFADDDDRVSLRSARFRTYIQAKPAADKRARTVLSFMPELQPLSKAAFDKTLPLNDPAILEWNPPVPKTKLDQRTDMKEDRKGQRYRGKVVLATSTINMDWTTWPGSPSFGAMMQELTRLAVSGRLREHAVLVGGALEGFLPGGNELDVTVHYPPGTGLADKKTRTQLVDDVNIFYWADTDASGIYRLTIGGSPQEHLFAVNVPPNTPDQTGSESDLTRLDKNVLKEMYGGWDFQVVTDPRHARAAAVPADDDVLVERGNIGPVVARFTLLLFLALLFLEVFLAWQFGHYSGVGGATEPPKTGRLWPALIGCVSAVLFVIGAGVLWHATQTGDFLGFWPVDNLRGWVEGWMGIPEPSPGEGRRWNLESTPFLLNADTDSWLTGFIALAALALVYFVYRAEAPATRKIYKALLGGLRLFLIFLTLAVLLPQLQLRFDRQGWPDIAIIIDDSRSMGEPDSYQNEQVRERVKAMTEHIRKSLQARLPERIKQAELAGKNKPGDTELSGRLKALQNQLAQLDSQAWRPTRLQLAQALIAQPDNDWLRMLVNSRHMKVHVFHLDAAGRAIRLTDAEGQAGDITEADPKMLNRAHQAIADLEAEGMDSRLGSAVRQVLDAYRGSSLSAVVMLTDGVTTRDETISQASEYAAQKGVPLFFVGIGDDHQIRDLKLHDLQVEDTVYVNDRIIFEARLTGHGYSNLTVPVVLKVKEKDREKEVHRELVKVDPTGRPVKFRLRHQPTEVGQKLYVIEVEPPKLDKQDRSPPPGNLRLERTIEVLETKLIHVLYVEGTARYEYRFIKSLLERESPDAKKKKNLDLKVVLLDADPDFPAQDRTALADFPATKQELDRYDVVIIGDCNPGHAKLGEKRLRMLADYVRGQDDKGNKGVRSGGGLLMIAGPMYSPHAFKDTPLADVLPIEPFPRDKLKQEPEERTDRYRLDLTPVGRQHPIFRFSPDEAENQVIWQKLAPMYWWSSGYRIKPLAEVLAVHPQQKADAKDAGQDPRHPLVVQQFVGSGRTMFFAFDESWRWRYREDELRFNQFWIQTVRYLSRHQVNKTTLRLDRQTPYRLGEPIKVTVKFPDQSSTPGDTKPGPKTEVRVIVEYRPAGKDDAGEPENQAMQLAKLEGSWGTYEAILTKTREGMYRFRLTYPDVSKQSPTGEKPEAKAVVELPPGELDRLRMNQQELEDAAKSSQGKFYTLAAADQLLDELPSGVRVSLSTSRPPFLLWNHLLIFVLVIGLFTAEWILRKRKHLL